MLLSLFLYLISYATPNVFSTILAGGLLSGLFGEVGLILMAGYSYVTDVTGKDRHRAPLVSILKILGLTVPFTTSVRFPQSKDFHLIYAAIVGTV